MDVPTELALFAGGGGGCLASVLMRHRIVCYVERDEYASGVLRSRIADGMLDDAPIWDDVCTFDGGPWRGLVDIISGGFPCQDISCAGRGAGIDGERSGLWGEFARIIREVRPRNVYVENSPMLTSRGLHRVLGDLAEMGFNARWGVLGADDLGAPHRRKRIWVSANQMADAAEVRFGVGGNEGLLNVEPKDEGRETRRDPRALVSISGELQPIFSNASELHVEGLDPRPREIQPRGAGWWASEPGVGRVADGVAHRVDRLKVTGNGQVPLVAATAWGLLT